MDRKAILKCDNLTYSYDKKKDIFRNVNLSVDSGEIFVILGPNGAGKTTLLNCLTHIFTPSSGKVLLKGKPIETYTIREIATMIGYVPQIATQEFSLSVRDFVVMGRAPYMGVLSIPGNKEYEIADNAIERMGISKLADKQVDFLSGGERQQVQIARVLAQEPEIILMDEPTNHLDYGNQLKIIEIISTLKKDGLSVVLTSHMPDHAILLNGKVGILERNGTFKSGQCEEIITEEELCKLYDTEVHLVNVDVLNRTVCVAGKSTE